MIGSNVPAFHRRDDVDFPDGDPDPLASGRRAERKNKLGLTDEERELMAGMSPKEKKQFLKGRG